jgi:methionyl aminopeptidase
MEEGDIFAIETFGTTGKGVLRDAEGVYGYGLTSSQSSNTALLHSQAAKSLLNTINDNFGTLVFARRQLERLPNTKDWRLGMKTLVDRGIVESYAPLVDIEGSFVAQFEHTVLLREGCKEVVSRGEDY